MSSKQVTDREKSASSVVAVGETQAKAVGDTLAKRLKAFLEKGETMPDLALVTLLVARGLDHAKKEMVRADAAHEAELGDDDGYRRARDAAADALSDKLAGLRDTMSGLYGAKAASDVFSGPMPDDPVVLSRFAGEVMSALGTVKLPAPRLKGATLDVDGTAAELKALRKDLDTAIKDVAREVREAQATLDAKNAAIAAYDDAFGGAAATLAGLLRLAGKPDLAAKVRPSSRRPGQTAADAGDAPAPAPANPPEKYGPAAFSLIPRAGLRDNRRP